MAYEMVMPYHLHMPSYFLETFTEYPQVISGSRMKKPSPCLQIFRKFRMRTRGFSYEMILAGDYWFRTGNLTHNHPGINFQKNTIN